MHELSVCLSLLEQVQQIARERDAATVSRIVLKIGPLSGVEPELLRHAYPVAAAGTLAEHAELVIEDMPVVVSCPTCGTEAGVLVNRLTCTNCGEIRTTVISGDEMILQRLELDSVRKPSPAHNDAIRH